MKHITVVVMVLIALSATQSCKKERSAEEVAAIAKAKADSVDSVNTAELNARRAKFEEVTASKKERLRLAKEESLKKGNTYKNAQGKLIYIKADEMPVYAGGEEQMTKYLQDNVQYPQAAKDNGEEGTVFVDFVIDKTGKVTDVVATDPVNSDVSKLLIDESIRVVSSMPAWTPAKHKGKPVDVGYNIPITFQIQDNL
jgi:TonB family protein